MKNLKLHQDSICLTFSLLLLCSCQDSTKSSSQQGKPSSIADWTVMVYVNGDNNLEQAAVEDFNEMAQVGSSSQVNLITQVDLIGVYFNIGWSDTRRFRVIKDMNPTNDSSPVMKIGEANMGDPKVLADFVNWSMQTYPAKKYALVIWDHGQGYRLYFANNKIREDAKSLVTLLTNTGEQLTGSSAADTISQQNNIRIMVGEPFRSVSNNSFKACSNDETNKDELFNREIQDGLAQALAGKKLDVLGFDACLMGMVETGYAMRHLTNYFVASEELEPNVGWKYEDWLQKLENNPTIDGEDLAKLFVDSYGSSYGNFTAQTMAAIDLSGFEDVTSRISKFASSLQAKLPTEFQAIRLARQDCAMYAPNPYHEQPPKDYFFHIDFVQFCDRLIQRTNDAQLKSEALDAKNALLAKVIKNYRGSLRSGSYGSNGMAIYFPVSNTQYKSDVFERGGYKKDNHLFPVEFVEKEKWADFLQAYFKVVP
jgi:hypothetical protein